MDLKTKLGAGVVSAAIALVAAWEGRSLIAYVDPVGIPTICDGYTQGVKLGDMASPQRCDALTEQEVRRALSVVDRSVSYPLPDEVRVALSSFVYNVGAGAYANSTLLRKLRARDIAGACQELDRWVYAGGRKLRGLERRRQAERQLCLSSLH
ncbi:lysozyme [Alcaligenes nematophilus]|jgi:lysozyme|uniref:Lysozyme n=1 Tax=Alcaligenes nematophilus TaxID=2994643 RepID=A0ABU3MVB9_9BURK|nr:MULTISPECIES: lysozyme [Alcaligenes]MDT8465466.1 lysozyme [Alcaligenes nematophilus]MDT8469983.1 lysozyme [Alcaligenes nematophilus]MDT8505541.1 lysozyme [Alcaligenes nematophilus]MDT8525711.1 lysozyme [Alcaligenes nematophilus]QCP82123.1 lysozyme [Alcaligenes faecalis]